jgi:hypothetical protein
MSVKQRLKVLLQQAFEDRCHVPMDSIAPSSRPREISPLGYEFDLTNESAADRHRRR